MLLFLSEIFYSYSLSYIMTKYIYIGFILMWTLIFTFNIESGEASRKIIIFAGQSNALGWRGNPGQLQENPADVNIPFCFHEGVPPGGAHPVPFNSTSDGEWTYLKPQIQDPYIALNEEFFGPEITLARSLYENGHAISVFKSAYGGTNLAKDWNKFASSGFHLYDTMMTHLDIALSRLREADTKFEFVGFFWMQGESDALYEEMAVNYEENLNKFIDNIRTDLAAPDLPFVICRIGDHMNAGFKDTVRNAQVKVAESDPLIKWVNTDYLPLMNDNLHYNTEGIIRLGTLMAGQYLGIISNVSATNNPVITDYKLYQNFPNPFNPATTIKYSIPKAVNSEKLAPEKLSTAGSIVNLRIYDVLGRQVATLVNKQQLPGQYRVTWDGSTFSSGVYFYTLSAGNYLETKKMVLLH